MNAMNKAMIRAKRSLSAPAATRNALYLKIEDHSNVFRQIATTLTVALESDMDEGAKNEAIDLMISVLNDTNSKLNGVVDSLRATEVAQ